jgi:hypothetical protein
VPGSAILNVGNSATISAISCPKVGDCSATGTYSPVADTTAVFVVSESSGTWGNAMELPGFATLNTGNGQDVSAAISCSSAGNCVAGGGYTNSSNYLFPFFASETNGTWGSAAELGGFPVTGGDAPGEVTAVDCTSNGNCSGGGFYGDTTGAQAFVVNATGDTWGSPEEVPGLGALNAGGIAFVTALSCFEPGQCAATGDYTDSSKNSQSFVVNATGGAWGTAIEVPGLAALNTSGNAIPEGISCGAATSCLVGGSYGISTNESQGFVASESNGTWGSAVEVAGTLDADNVGTVNDVSCTAATTCVAGGSYEDSSAHTQAFLADETNGTWANAVEVPGSTALNSGGDGAIYVTSCSSTGNCAAAGSYTDSSGNYQAFVVNESSGTWGGAIEVPGTPGLNSEGGAAVLALSCASDGSCGLGGFYTDSSNNTQAFVDGSVATLSTPSAPSIRVTSTTPGAATITLTRAVVNGGDPVTSYEYSVNGGAWVKVGSSSSKSFVVHHLTAFKVYRLRLRAVNVLGAGAASASVSVTAK